MTTRTFSFRDTALGLTAGATMLALATFPAAAQKAGAPLTEKQCSDAISIGLAIVQKNEGKISSELRDSFVRFGRSRCDLNTDWKLVGKKDEDIFGEFRVRLIAMRMAEANSPNALAQQ